LIGKKLSIVSHLKLDVLFAFEDFSNELSALKGYHHQERWSFITPDVGCLYLYSRNIKSGRTFVQRKNKRTDYSDKFVKRILKQFLSH